MLHYNASATENKVTVTMTTLNEHYSLVDNYVHVCLLGYRSALVFACSG